MPLTDAQHAELERFPPLLRQLLNLEIDAGNEILEVGHGHPAAPIGAYAMLKGPVTTRVRDSTDGYRYRPETSSRSSGWFTDETGHFFVLEPPDPNAGAYPDMNQIRELSNVSTRQGTGGSRDDANNRDVAVGSVLDRFIKSTQLDYNQWREGESYDVTLIRSASEEERNQLEQFLVRRAVSDWRDVEALAAIDSPRTRNILYELLKSGTAEKKLWVWDHAPMLLGEVEKVELLVNAIETTDIYHGLGRALDRITQIHPPAIIDALLKATLVRSGDVACHFAAMLYYLHGLSNEPFDWDHRPFFLRFNTDSTQDRQTAFRELCAMLGADASRFLD